MFLGLFFCNRPVSFYSLNSPQQRRVTRNKATVSLFWRGGAVSGSTQGCDHLTSKRIHKLPVKWRAPRGSHSMKETSFLCYTVASRKTQPQLSVWLLLASTPRQTELAQRSANPLESKGGNGKRFKSKLTYPKWLVAAHFVLIAF